MLPWILLGVGIVLTAMTAVYVAAEFALVTVDRAAVDAAAAGGDISARRVRSGLARLSTQLSGAQVGITVTTLALGYVMEPSLAQLLAPLVGAIGLSAGVADAVAVAIALLVATAVSMVFGELVPKNLAIARPLATARLVIAANTVTTKIFAPAIAVLNGTANLLLRALGITPTEELSSPRSAQELAALVQRSGARGTIEADNALLVVQTLRFSSKTADDILTPRVDIVAVRDTDTAADIIGEAARSGRSRFPVIGTDIDEIRGLVHVKHAVAVPLDRRGTIRADSLMVPAPRVPGTLALDDLLVQLRQRGLQMVVVADEYGGTAGLVTLEDAVEELVGEIVDEHDAAISGCRRLADDTVLIPGSLRPDEIEPAIGLALPPPQEYETVAGLLLERLGRLAQRGDHIDVAGTLRADSSLGGDAPMPVDLTADLPRPITVRLSVASLDGRRIAVVRAAALREGADGREAS